MTNEIRDRRRTERGRLAVMDAIKAQDRRQQWFRDAQLAADVDGPRVEGRYIFNPRELGGE